MTRTKIKTILIAVALVLALILVGGLIAQTVTNKQKHTAHYTAVEETDGLQVGLSDVKTGVKLSSARIASEEYGEYGITAQAESAYTLTASVTPANATNQTLKWELSFVDPSASWASDKTPSNYVALNVNGTQATLECISEFSEPMYVTATSVSDSTKYARCRLDYKQKVTNLTLSVGGFIAYPLSGGYSYVDGKRLGDCRLYPIINQPVTETAEIDMTISQNYTIPLDLSKVKFEITPTTSLYDSLVTSGYENANLLAYVITTSDGESVEVPNFLDIVWAQNIICSETVTADDLNELRTSLLTKDTFSAYELKCYLGDTEPARTYSLLLDCSKTTIAVDNVTFDKTAIEF